MQQLRMIFPLDLLPTLALPAIPEGFELRSFRPGDEQAYADLMVAAGFTEWTREKAVETAREKALPDGIFFAVEKATGRLAGTAMANRPDDIGHEMGWVGVHPDFRGKGLARLVSTAALMRFKTEPCAVIYLLTDDFRQHALRLYLHMGWKEWMPAFCDDTHPGRWKAIHDTLGIKNALNYPCNARAPMNTPLRRLVALALCAVVFVLGAQEIRMDFTRPDPVRWDAGKFGPVYDATGGVDNSPCARLTYKGRAIRHTLPTPLADRVLEITSAIRCDSPAITLRFSFGQANIDWRTFQGYCNVNSPDQNWHTLRVVITPHPKTGGAYKAFLDGREIKSDVYLPPTDKPITNLQWIYLGEKDGDIRVDDIVIRHGEKITPKPQDLLAVTFPAAAAARTAVGTDRLVMDLILKGDSAAFSNFRIAAFPNDRNHPDEAAKTPCSIGRVEILPDGAGAVATLDRLPYGMHTVRIWADCGDARGVLLGETLVSRTHPAPRPAPKYPIRWGIDNQIQRPARDDHWKLDAPLLAACGVNWTRLELNIYNITGKEPGSMDFSHIDKAVAALRRHGISILMTLNCRPKWTNAGITPLSDMACLSNESAWEEVCRRVMTRYKGQVEFYELWNEPQHYNWDHFEPGVINEEHYGKLLQVTRRVAAEIDPAVKVMGPCLTQNMNDWIDGIQRVNGFDGIEYFSYHDNIYPDYRAQAIQRRLKNVTGRTFKLFATESSNDPRRLISSFAGETVSAAFGYVIVDMGHNRNNYEHNFGLTKYDGLPKDRHVTYTYMATMLNHAEYIGRIFSTDDVNGYLFKENNAYKAVVWANCSNRLPKLAFAPGVRRLDKMGNPFPGDTLDTVPDGTRVYDYAPRKLLAYLTNLPPDSDEVLAACVNCDSDYKCFDVGPGQTLGLSFRNESDKPRTFTLSIRDIPGIRFGKPVTATVPPGQTVRAAIELNAGADAPYGELYLDADIRVDGKTLPRRFGPIRIFVPQRVHTQTVWRGGKDNPLVLPKTSFDVHAEHSTGVARDVQDQSAATRGTRVSLVKAPDRDHAVTRLDYIFHRPAKGWLPSIWLASTVLFQKPIPLPGIPLRLSVDYFMENNTDTMPLTLIYLFEDPTGKTIRFEASNLYFSGWRSKDCHLQSLFTHGFIHGVSGGNGRRAVDAYPLKLKGIIFNLIPLTSVVHAPRDAEAITGSLLIDNIRVEYYQ